MTAPKSILIHEYGVLALPRFHVKMTSLRLRALFRIVSPRQVFTMADQLLESLSDRSLTLDGLIEEQNAIRMNETENDTFAFVESMNAFVESMKNKNTKSKTTVDLKNFKEWMRNEHLNEDRNLEDIPSRILDMYLARFFLTVRKQDKEEYEPDTFKSFKSSFQRYLTVKFYASNILKDDCFKYSYVKAQNI